MPIPEEHQDDVRRQFNERNCHPVFVSEAETELAEGLWNDVLWPLFHYIPVRTAGHHPHALLLPCRCSSELRFRSQLRSLARTHTNAHAHKRTRTQTHLTYTPTPPPNPHPPQLSMLESDTEMIHQRWGAYERLNVAMAAVATTVIRPSDLVLIHDYHLMMLPAALRERQPKVKIGWFLHTPFPSAEIYVTLPLRKALLRGVLAADLIAFHTFDYVRHFMNSCSRVLGTDITVESTYILDSSKRTAVTVDAFPTGIDTELFQAMLTSAALKDKVDPRHADRARHLLAASLVAAARADTLADTLAATLADARR